MGKIIGSVLSVVFFVALAILCMTLWSDSPLPWFWNFFAGSIYSVLALLCAIRSIKQIRDYTKKKRFVVADHFTTDNATVEFSYIGDSFKSRFYGKTEEAKDVSVPRVHHDLCKFFSDREILDDLGNKAETTMAGIYELLKLQPTGGEAGALLINGFVNIFFVRDVKSVPRIVFIGWYDGNWDMDAVSVKDTCGWHTGRRVFSN